MVSGGKIKKEKKKGEPKKERKKEIANPIFFPPMAFLWEERVLGCHGNRGGAGSLVVVLGLGGMALPCRLLYCFWGHFLGLQLGPLCPLVELSV